MNYDYGRIRPINDASLENLSTEQLYNAMINLGGIFMDVKDNPDSTYQYKQDYEVAGDNFSKVYKLWELKKAEEESKSDQ